MRSRSLILWVVAAFAVAALFTAPAAHVAHASTSGIVISAIYGGGGDATGPGGSVLSPYTHDYIEIFNAGTTAVTMANWSVQYRDSPTGSAWEKTNIPAGTVLQPGQYFLTQQDPGGDGVGSALPTPDAIGSASMTRAGNFVVAVMSTWTTITGDDPRLDPATQANVVDLFGGGDATTELPNTFETAVRTGILDNTTAWFRNNSGCQDTDNNLNDFASGPVAGMARNTATTLAPCAASADLTVTVSDTPDPVLTGSPITYTVNVPNSGTAAANSAVISVGLTGSAYPGSIGNLSNNTDCSFTNPTITCNVASIAAAGSFSFTFTVTPATAGTVTANATVSAAPPETTGNNTGSASTTVNDPIPTTADVSVTIADSPDPVDEGNAVGYTVTVNNTGNAAATNTVLTVTLGGGSYPGTISGLTGTGCSFTTPTITCNLGTIAATNGSSVVTFNITPTADGTITANATVSANAPETAGNNTDSETTTVNPVVVTTADVSVTVADAPDPVETGNAVAYTVTVNNTGNAAAANTVLTVTLGGASYPGTITGLTGTGCVFATPTVTCNIGALAATNGSSVVTFSVTPTVAGTITADAAVSADAPETGGNNTDSETTTVNAPAPELGSFDLVSPDEGQILRTTTTNFQWTEAAGATSYEVFLSNLSTNTRLGESYSVTKNAGDVCAAGICSVASTELVANLEQGTYSWTVIATDGADEVEATDGPNLFTVVLDGIVLVANGGLEDGSTGWTFTTGAKRKCGGFGDGSDCAFKLLPGSKAHQRGVMGPILAATDTDLGDVLQVSAAVRTNKTSKQRVVMVVVTYADPTAGAAGNGKDKFKLFVEEATTGYETFSANFALDGEITSGRIVVANTLPAGGLRVDNVSVVLMPIGTTPRAEVPASVDGVLPVPAAPDNFRGNN